MATPSQLLGQTISHYRIVEKLGGGGMGVERDGPNRTHQDHPMEILNGRIPGKRKRPPVAETATIIIGQASLQLMSTRVDRPTVDLSGYPDLVVIYLGMRVNRITGIKTLLGFGPKISASAEAQRDGLLQYETVIYSLFLMHIGMRQYWRDVDALLKWTRSDPHRIRALGHLGLSPTKVPQHQVLDEASSDPRSSLPC